MTGGPRVRIRNIGCYDRAMNNLAIHDILRDFAACLRLDDVIPSADIEAGLEHLEAEAERIALDAYSAQRRGVPLSEAACDFVNFPQLARFHAAVDDILSMSIPPELVTWVQSLLSMPEPPSFDGMRTAMVAAAADPVHPRRQALARFALFEGVRLNLVLATRWFPHETIGVGVEMGDLDRIAEARVASWLAAGPAVPNDVRPFHVIVSAAVHALNAHAEELRAGLVHLQCDFVVAAERRAAVEEMLNEMDVRDALLIRNEIAPAFGEQRLTVEHLQERHGFVLGDVSRNALDKRIGRARTRSKDGLRRRRVALVDLLGKSAAVGGE
jgi:hypothetical protein